MCKINYQYRQWWCTWRDNYKPSKKNRQKKKRSRFPKYFPTISHWDFGSFWNSFEQQSVEDRKFHWTWTFVKFNRWKLGTLYSHARIQWTSQPNMHEILSGFLWLGDLRAASNEKELEKNEITHILNVADGSFGKAPTFESRKLFHLRKEFVICISLFPTLEKRKI